MTESQKIALMWLVAALVFAAGIVLCFGHSVRVSWQGAAASDLLKPRFVLKPASNIFSLPLAPIQSVPRNLNLTRYFAATATDRAGLESDFSNEVSLDYTNGQRWVTLAWDPSPSTNEIVNYTVYQGWTSQVYTATYQAGTNLSISIPLVRTNTNLVVTVTCLNGTGLFQALTLRGPWFSTYSTTWAATNPQGRLFFKALGAGSRVEIKTKWQ